MVIHFTDTILIHFLLIILCSFTFIHGTILLDNNKFLNVGDELLYENLPLQKGSCQYQLLGLKSNSWYEVKISYPASIPASFSIELKKGILDLNQKFSRKLLNTEKLVFKTDNFDLVDGEGGWFVLVSVEPEGVVAIQQAKEREHVTFNIVCDELVLGIPHKAWVVVVFVVICLGVAFVVPGFLPSYLLPKEQTAHLVSDVSKDS
ncbi:hypothetical protein LIER_13691 [Lithospermum erythrorhizon]|uniref:Uncharacterized protein n=1 Tax=Lithospermum erythrorhizon TaxID=34254 RepID=A0AAV3PWC2_LITER